MRVDLPTTLVMAMAVGTALMAGIYFAFSGFVLRSLGTLDGPAGAEAMRAINRVIVRSWFMPLFFGTSAGCAALVGASLLGWRLPGAPLAVAGAGIYLIGMLGVTAAGNVPLNEALERAPTRALAEVWPAYQRDWGRLNHGRTLASLSAAGLLFSAVLVGASTAPPSGSSEALRRPRTPREAEVPPPSGLGDRGIRPPGDSAR